jgi:hypothetical protein
MMLKVFFKSKVRVAPFDGASTARLRQRGGDRSPKFLRDEAKMATQDPEKREKRRVIGARFA